MIWRNYVTVTLCLAFWCAVKNQLTRSLHLLQWSQRLCSQCSASHRAHYLSHFWATVCYAIGTLSVCLSVTLVYCGQTVGWIKMKLGMDVGLGPAHTVLEEDPAPPPPKGAQPPNFGRRNFGPCLLRPNCWLDQDATWYGGRPRPRPHCVRWGPVPPTQKRHTPNFRPISIEAKRSPISATSEHLLSLSANRHL